MGPGGSNPSPTASNLIPSPIRGGFSIVKSYI